MTRTAFSCSVCGAVLATVRRPVVLIAPAAARVVVNQRRARVTVYCHCHLGVEVFDMPKGVEAVEWARDEAA